MLCVKGTLRGVWYREQGLGQRAFLPFDPDLLKFRNSARSHIYLSSSLAGSFFSPRESEDSLGLKSSLLHPLQGQITSLSLSFLIFKMGTVAATSPSSRRDKEILCHR